MNNADGWLTNFESRISAFAGTAEHLAEVTGQSALHAAIQEPLDGVTQLVNHISKPLTGYTLPNLHLIDAPPPAKPGSSDWYAEAIGTGLGRAVDCAVMATGLGAIGVTGAAGGALGALFETEAASTLAATVGSAAVSGATYGFLLIPSKDENHFWKQRAVDGLSWAAAAGAARLTAAGAEAIIENVGEKVATEGLSTTLAGRTARAVVGGSTSGLTKNEMYVIFGQADRAPGALGGKMVQSIARSVVTEAATEP